MDLSEHKSFARMLAMESGELIKRYFEGADVAVDLKRDKSPVTAADREAELLMREHVKRRFPSHGIVGEEYGSENETAEWVWIFDPIDGTNSFIHRVPLFGTLIALLHRGAPVLGLIHQPILGQLMEGDGAETVLNGRPVRMRERALSDATLLCSDFTHIEKQRPAGFAELHSKVKLTRTWGDCYGYLLLAAGLADIMLDPWMNPWDVAALIPIVRGAGGVITGWEGGDALAQGSAVAASPSLHPHVLAMLQGGK
jgi:myo-inositol-1(or 4)-monophosphatase